MLSTSQFERSFRVGLIPNAVKSILFNLTSRLEIAREDVASNFHLALESVLVKLSDIVDYLPQKLTTKSTRIIASFVLALSMQFSINSPLLAETSISVKSKEALQICTLPWAQTGMNLTDGKIAGTSLSKYPGSTVNIKDFLIKDKPNNIEYPTITTKVKVSDLLVCGIDLNNPNATGNFVTKVTIQKWDKSGNLVTTITGNIFLASFQANVTTENGIDYLNLVIDTTSYFPATFNQRKYIYYARVENIQQGIYIPNPWGSNPPFLTDYSKMAEMPNIAFLNNGLVVEYWLGNVQYLQNTMKGAPSSWNSLPAFSLNNQAEEWIFKTTK